MVTVSEQCRACIVGLENVVSSLSRSRPGQERGVHHGQVNDELERLSLWTGNIGALHRAGHLMSLESRLIEARDVLTHILELLDDLNSATGELSDIVSGAREGEIAYASPDHNDEEDQSEETELLREIGTCITRLFRASRMIRQAAPTDLFAKALSRKRYQFNDQFDIAHVGEKHPKLATENHKWLQVRLGRAITRRRHYLSYIQDHRQKLEGNHEDTFELEETKPQAPPEHPPTVTPQSVSASRPSTFFTKASSLTPGYITPQMLSVEDESDHDDDARSYTTITRSVDGDLDLSTTVRIPKLDDLRKGSKKEVECPFCFRVKNFKSERMWRRHVFSDLRSYICTFRDCDAPYFSDINEWFRHEMKTHRVSYTCLFCQSKTFQLKERYLAHIRKEHSIMLEDGGQEAVLDIARKPLDQIPAQDCPCCSEWVGRLHERAVLAGMLPDTSSQTLHVVPTDFKRHLASHLEQLALFAIPINSATEADANSTAAVNKDEGALTQGSNVSNLVFDDSRPSSPARSWQSFDETEAVARERSSERVKLPMILNEEEAKAAGIKLSAQPGSITESDAVMEDYLEPVGLEISPYAITPTYEGFKTHVRHLNPRIADYMVERSTQEQIRRYKRLLDYKQKHHDAVKNRGCLSGDFCIDSGGQPQLLPPRVKENDPSAPDFIFQTTSSKLPEEVGPVQFPSGFPMPPVERLPAEFECPLCFKTKKIYKPSEWTKHVNEDIQPFVCTFQECRDVKGFRRNADWVRHETERHRHLESWVCDLGDCRHTCFRRDNFAQHLVREHKIGEPQRRAPTKENNDMSTKMETEDVWSIVERCRRDTANQPEDEPCPFCGNISKTWKKLTVHLSKHMEQIAVPILPLIEQYVIPDHPSSSIDDQGQPEESQQQRFTPFENRARSFTERLREDQAQQQAMQREEYARQESAREREIQLRDAYMREA